MVSPDVRILGTGIVSRAAALALAHDGLSVAVQRRAAPAVADLRAYALNAASVALLARLRVWDSLPADARTPVQDMRVQGDQGAEIGFSAWQQGVGALAWIVDAAALEDTLEAALRFAPRISAQDEPAAAALTVIAEGKASAAREALGVRFQRHGYGHHALAARLLSDRPHQGLARQWFRSPDVLALLPLDRPQPGCSYALVWSQPEASARHWREAAAAELEAALAEATGGAAGALQLASERATWPLSLGHASATTGPGWVLLGDAAHVVHPLAGQGLNLGLADVASLAEVLAARESWRALGDAALLRRHARRRSGPNHLMAGTTDGLWQLFGHPHPLLRELRHHGLTLVDRLPPLKRWLVDRALGA
ncbi:FAD-dependent monooxygenase [Ideonella sp. 4Y11]|uniref:FAD-dependent monooxygenase n=1 Tax=Ideonella aquatica TaxID=2824119 RepID=A0A941BK65_9BURK|nr:FAD-dependent monooxygenase [Ideonella aquatica]MBQ0960207.1 FAD-dependent monooxygenase [Ideonella aquatica]